MLFTNNLNPDLLSLGPLTIRWYGLFFATGILLNYFVTRAIFKKEKLKIEDLESVAIYLVLGVVIGARLGHVLFYNLDYFISHPLEIFQIWQGGLSSHGAALGVLISYFLWIKINHLDFKKYADLLVISMPLTAMFVRIGNFFNSEIVGKPTEGNFGVIFQKLDENFPRHPSQLYEAIQNLFIFIILYLVYRKYYQKIPPLFILLLYVTLYFSTRFMVEFWKEKFILTDFSLSMGQILSIPGIIIGLAYFLFYYQKKTDTKNKLA